MLDSSLVCSLVFAVLCCVLLWLPQRMHETFEISLVYHMFSFMMWYCLLRDYSST